MELGEILRLAARRTPEKTAIIADGRRLSFEEYDRLANRFANFLIARGVGHGDRIATVLFNSPEYGVVHFGNARAGSVLVHIPPLYAPAEIAEIVERTRPRLLVVDAAVQDRIGAEVRDAVPAVMVAGGPDFEAALAAVSDGPPDRAIDPAAPVAMTFTGGTTGRPKGAVVSHTARYVSAASTAREHQVTEQDVVGVVVPMFHAVGLMIWYQAAILRGCTAVILRRWDPAEFVAATERHGISSVFLVPVQVRDLLRSPAFDPDRLASLKNIGVGGAPTPPGLIEECRDALPHCGYTDHYGQSETGPLTILKPEETEAHAGTVGRPAAGVELRIVDGDGNSVPPGTVGELVTRGPYMMEGYFGDEDETARYFRGGWGWTGDLGRVDEDGYVTLVGRSREIIISGGFNIHPSEVETALASHPAVEDCTVFGVPDDRWGEAPVAYVVRAADISGDDLIAHCTDRLARYKRPREIVFVATIPRTPSGKVRKPLLRDAYLKA
ncbi:MAG: AMP-binding protein [Acidobacteria bacterium]|nr:AMP-binding protein [Acidobacteriota bacterium]MYF13991.1 AMP-binding protein [Acidobacteriota bacterium]MYI95775.1 AMP-binding protein [Acidobacteriota bacterium]